MPKYNRILNIPGFTIKKVSGHQPLVFELEYYKKARCSHCNSGEVRKKDSFMREVKDEMLGHRMSLLRFKAFKLYCNQCKRYGNQKFPGIGKYQRATHRLHAQIFYQHTKVSCPPYYSLDVILGGTCLNSRSLHGFGMQVPSRHPAREASRTMHQWCGSRKPGRGRCAEEAIGHVARAT